MNKVVLMGRLTRDPEIRYTQGDNMIIARYTLAVNRKYKRDGEPDADFIQCVSFAKAAEFAEKYFKKGMRVAVSGRIQTGNYTNKEGQKIYTTDVILEEQEFAESKSETQQDNTSPRQRGNTPTTESGDGFMNIPDGIDEELPFA